MEKPHLVFSVCVFYVKGHHLVFSTCFSKRGENALISP